MRELEDAVLRLEANGLYTNWGKGGGIRLSERRVQSVKISNIPPVIPFAFNYQHHDQISHLFYEENLWRFVYWRWVAGPGPEDFSVEFEHLSEAIKTIKNFYSGEPLVVEGWIIPFHRHPELDTDTIIYTIKNNIIQLTESQFKQAKETISRTGEKLNKGGFLDVLPFRFLKIRHQSEQNHCLYLRRDGEIAYIVGN